MYSPRSLLADDESDLGGVPGQEDRRLPRRVAAADDGHRVSAAEQRLRLRRRVVDAHLLEVLRARHVEPAVPGAGGDDHQGAGHGGSVAEPHRVLAVVPLDGRGLGGHGELGAELPRLEHRPLREFGAGDAGREAEVVLDPRRGPGLASGGGAVQDDDPQAFRGPVHGGGHARRARTRPRAGRSWPARRWAPGARSRRPARRCWGCGAAARARSRSGCPAAPRRTARAVPRRPGRPPDPATGTEAGYGPRSPGPAGCPGSTASR